MIISRIKEAAKYSPLKQLSLSSQWAHTRGYPLVEVRAKTHEMKAQIRKSIDPIQQKQDLHIQKLRNRTFHESAQIVIANKSHELKNQKYIAQ